MTLDSYIAGLKGKRIAVVGLGVSNMPLLRTLLSAGCRVTARDRRTEEAFGTEEAARLRAAGCALRLGPDYLEDLSEDVIFRTPGLHPFQHAGKGIEGIFRTVQAVHRVTAIIRSCPFALLVCMFIPGGHLIGFLPVMQLFIIQTTLQHESESRRNRLFSVESS